MATEAPPAEAPPRRRPFRRVGALIVRLAAGDRLGGGMALRPGLAAGGPLDAGRPAGPPVPQPGLSAGVLGPGGAERAVARRLRRRPACGAGRGDRGGALAGDGPRLAGRDGRPVGRADRPRQPGGARMAGGPDRPVGLTAFHVLAACARGGRLRHFLWPFGHPFWLIRRVRAGGLYRRVARRLLGLRGGAPAAILLPARARRLPRHPRLADRAGHAGRGRRPLARSGDRRGPAPGDRRALPAVLASPIRPGGPGLGPVLAAGDPRAVPHAPRGPSPSR